MIADLDQIFAYANGMNANGEVVSWIDQILRAAFRKKRAPNQGEIEHIIDFLVSPAAPRRLLKMSITQAKEAAEKWSKANQKKGRGIHDDASDIDVIHSYADGSGIVKLKSKKAYEREGYLMSHCLGGYSLSNDLEIYSYRDAKNMPHATFEVRRQGGEVTQIKGKGNGPIHPKYIMPIMDFLTSINQKPRPSEMKNLGYHHIDKAHHDFVKSIVGAEKNYIFIHGEMYAHS